MKQEIITDDSEQNIKHGMNIITLITNITMLLPCQASNIAGQLWLLQHNIFPPLRSADYSFF